MRRGTWAADADLIYRQSSRGVIRAATLIGMGMMSRTVYGRCRAGGPWRRLLPGVILLSPGQPSAEQRIAAALLYARHGAIVTGREACRLHGLRQLPDIDKVHLLVNDFRKPLSSEFVIVERTTRLPPPQTRNGFPVAPLVRAALDTSRRLRTPDPVRALLAEAVQRGRCKLEDLERELAQGSQRGSAVPRRVLAAISLGARSVAEMDAMRVWERSGLPKAQWNVPVRDAHGTLIGVPDAWCAEASLAWEIDSYEFHLNPKDYARTLQRNTRYAMAGIHVVQTLPSRLRTAPDDVAAELVQAYEAAISRARGTA
ncbi:hypothetical protein NLX83_03000 [Allokutzneria sp. A3M-2-11 16]|uniref:hypothetical protein n=1 Tax=Allokutzneria sp. A3M-2-11 16 TaxID=2962043 RepID=UPI0020B8AEA9|nr:hypothetical protein [Allokutzneria sp. A3M-2-11 16]MCP3798217.1 hypothetical protein [Allokutzneria sp. A3M-2-11 16]